MVNGATFLDGLTSGGFFTISGSNLATSTQTWSVPGVNLPITTGGSQVFVNGKPAYISYASPTQINALAPVDSFVGPVSVEVVTSAGTSNTASVNKKAVAPGLFMFAQGGQRYAVVTSTDGSYSIPAGLVPGARIRAAKPGDVVTLWTTGLGPTNPAYPDGQIVTKVGVLTMPYSATIGGKPALIDFAGIVGPGLYQINLHVPQVPSGDNAIVLTVNGVNSQSGAYIYIGQ